MKQSALVFPPSAITVFYASSPNVLAEIGGVLGIKCGRVEIKMISNITISGLKLKNGNA